MTTLLLVMLAFESQADVVERLGESVPLEVAFTTSEGLPVRLGDLVRGDTPTVLVLTWYECPMLCGLVLKGVIDAAAKLDADHPYRLLTVSFDPRDTVPNARRKQQSTQAAMKSPRDWPFLVGGEESIRALTEAVGFRYAWEPSTKQFAHPAVVVVLTPDGRVSRYLYGIDYGARDLRLALAEASQGRTVSTLDRVMLTCFRYDPATRRYGLAIRTFLRTGAGLIFVGLLVGFVWLRRKEASS